MVMIFRWQNLKDELSQTPGGSGIDVMTALLKTDADQYMIEAYKELSAEYASMKKNYSGFVEKEGDKGTSKN